MEKIQLTVPQRRALQSSLLFFERALRSADRMISDGGESGHLYRRKTHLDQRQREVIQTKISQTLADLADFAKTLELAITEEPVERIIAADMSTSWSSLEECRSKRMSGYGKLDPRAAEIIDPTIDRFAKAAIELSDLVSSSSEF